MIIDIKVTPRAKKQLCKLTSNHTLHCYLISAPESNKANNELIALLSKALKIPKASITILLGATSRTKRIEIQSEITLEKLYSALGIERQTLLF